MQETQHSRIPDDRRYTNEHIWIRRDGGAFVCGITDFAQDQLDEVVYVGLPAPGSAFAAGESFGTVESMPYTNDTCRRNIRRSLELLPDVELVERTLPVNAVRDAMHTADALHCGT